MSLSRYEGGEDDKYENGVDGVIGEVETKDIDGGKSVEIDSGDEVEGKEGGHGETGVARIVVKVGGESR